MSVRKFITLLDRNEYVATAGGRDEVKAEVVHSLLGLKFVSVKFGDDSALMDLETAEAIATALRFHQMGEWGDREDAR